MGAQWKLTERGKQRAKRRKLTKAPAYTVQADCSPISSALVDEAIRGALASGVTSTSDLEQAILDLHGDLIVGELVRHFARFEVGPSIRRLRDNTFSQLRSNK